MPLREHLTEFTKEELLDQARIFSIRKCSGLRKAELIDRIVEVFCDEEMMRSRLACLTKEQMNIVRKACIAPVDISINEVMDAMQLFMYWIGSFDEETDRFCVFEEVKEAFGKIDDEAFKADQNRKGWMVKCVRFFEQYYGIAPLEVIYEMYRQKVRCSIDEMIEMFWEMPIDIVESAIVTMDMLGMHDWPESDPIYSKNGILVHLSLIEGEEFDYLLRQQMGQDFYIPSARQIDEICKMGYEASSLAYKKLETFFEKKLGMDHEEAVTWCLQVWENSYEGESPTEVANRITEDMVFDNENMVRELIDLLMSAHNNTRLKENRGHKPIEIARRNFTGGIPTIVPASSKAAAILQEAAPELEDMGIPVDLNGDTLKNGKKVYPNDPCPCGSGKKYKKCCGKNR